jgi:transcriptional regulator with XRE-family HTH domain
MRGAALALNLHFLACAIGGERYAASSLAAWTKLARGVTISVIAIFAEKTMSQSLPQEIDKKAVGSRIREVRGKRTQTAFAEMMDATQSYISDLERGKCFPSIVVLARLKEVSGRSFDWLLTGSDEPAAPTAPPEHEDVDYIQMQRLINLLEDAPPSEKPRFAKMLIAHLIGLL